MTRRALAFLFLVWLAGFAFFAILLPRPLPGGGGRAVGADAVIVLTGGEGRIQRALAVLERGEARHLLVSGVYGAVKPHEFALEYKVQARLMRCCIELGYESTDTRSNARESARWIARNRFRTVRLVTSDWHMRRAAYELERMKPADVTVLRDAVATQPSLRILFLEYNKLLARRVAALWGG